MLKRSLMKAALAAMLLAGLNAPSHSFPTQPVKLVLGFGPGGGADGLARLYAAELQKVLGTPVIVENRAGAYEQLAGRAVLSAPADGHTLWLATTGGVVQAPLIRDMPYNPATDFTPIGVIAEADAVLAAKNDLPVKNMDELIAYARANPGKLNYASAGTGAPSHLLVEYIQAVTGVQTTHIPYKSAADAAGALISGDVDFAVIVPASSASLIQAKRIRGLAVTSAERIPSLPDVPTLKEGSIKELHDMIVYAFYAILAPKDVPADVVTKLNQAFNEVSRSDAIREASAKMIVRPVTTTPQEFSERIQRESAIWGGVAKRIK